MLMLTGCSHFNIPNLQNNKYTDKLNGSKGKNVDIESNITKHTIDNVSLDNNELLDNIKELCKSPRKYNTDGERRTIDFLVDKMTNYGYIIKTQEFNVYKKTAEDLYCTTWEYFHKQQNDQDYLGKSKNVIASINNSNMKKTLYITAHYDTSSKTNGIMDNASGVAVAMEIARQLYNKSLPVNIEFVFFGAEEAGLQGSAYFVSQLTQEEKNNTLGCINIDVVGGKGDNKIEIKTYSAQITVMSILINQLHEFSNSGHNASDHVSFYMGGIPAVYFADEIVKVKDSSDNPLEVIEISKLKELTQIICNFVLNFKIDKYNDLLENSYTKKYIDIPSKGKLLGYSLVQISKALRKDGAGSDIHYIFENNQRNTITIIEKDSRFLNAQIIKEIQGFKDYNRNIKYEISEDGENAIIKGTDIYNFRYYELKGKISEEEGLKLLADLLKFTEAGKLIWDLK